MSKVIHAFTVLAMIVVLLLASSEGAFAQQSNQSGEINGTASATSTINVNATSGNTITTRQRGRGNRISRTRARSRTRVRVRSRTRVRNIGELIQLAF